MPAILVIESCVQGAFCALIDTEKKAYLWHSVIPDQGGRSHQLLRLFQQGFALTGIGPENLAGIAVGAGPGSFTGIKMSLAFIYGLASSHTGKKLGFLSLNTLACMAAKLNEEAQSKQIKNSGLFWSATRQHGFWVRDQHATSVFDFNQRQAWSPEMQTALKNLEVLYLLGSWDLDFATMAGVDRERCHALTLDEIFRVMGEAILEKVLISWPFTGDLPKPHYGRLSTAEEALELKEKANSNL